MPVPALDAHIGYWLRLVSNSVSQRFARTLAGEGVTVAEWVALRALFDSDEALPSELADQLKLTRGAISKLADRLERKLLVERRAAPGDGRSHYLSLSDAGRQLVPRLAGLADRNDADFFGFLLPADRSTLERVLRAIVAQRGITGIPLD